MSTKQEILDEIVRERAYQDSKWGTVDEHPHSLIEWIVIAEDCLAKAKAGYFKGGDPVMKQNLIEAAATVFAALEQHDVTYIVNF